MGSCVPDELDAALDHAARVERRVDDAHVPGLRERNGNQLPIIVIPDIPVIWCEQLATGTGPMWRGRGAHVACIHYSSHVL